MGAFWSDSRSCLTARASASPLFPSTEPSNTLFSSPPQFVYNPNFSDEEPVFTARMSGSGIVYGQFSGLPQYMRLQVQNFLARLAPVAFVACAVTALFDLVESRLDFGGS